MRIFTWNVIGLRSPGKRHMILRPLKRLGADVALLQEMHLEAKDFAQLHYSWVGGVFFAPQLKPTRQGSSPFCTRTLIVRLHTTKTTQKGDGPI